jgi:hypothetical protein
LIKQCDNCHRYYSPYFYKLCQKRGSHPQENMNKPKDYLCDQWSYADPYWIEASLKAHIDRIQPYKPGENPGRDKNVGLLYQSMIGKPTLPEWAGTIIHMPRLAGKNTIREKFNPSAAIKALNDYNRKSIRKHLFLKILCAVSIAIPIIVMALSYIGMVLFAAWGIGKFISKVMP